MPAELERVLVVVLADAVPRSVVPDPLPISLEVVVALDVERLVVARAGVVVDMLVEHVLRAVRARWPMKWRVRNSAIASSAKGSAAWSLPTMP